MALDSQKRVVIVGGGFGGLYAAKELSGKKVSVVLIDKKNHHTFQPLLYQVATTVLSPGQIASPLRKILRDENVEVLLDEVTAVDLANGAVQLREGISLSYDYLVVAAGARHSYFGHDEWEPFAPGLKTLEDATNLRRLILMAFENAEKEAYLEGRDPELTIAIVGGGPTGVEIAGSIADIAKRVVTKDFKSIRTEKTRILLFEGSPRILASFPPEISVQAKRQLEELGIEVREGVHVNEVEKHRIRAGEEWIDVRVTVWATGVAASPLGKQMAEQVGKDVDRSGRVPIESDLSLSGHPEVFVIGDLASLTDVNGVHVPGLGAAAMQEGVHVARNILLDLAGQRRKPFAYRDKGNLATIGRNRAVAVIGKWQFSGFLAWALWALVHVFLLIGFRNRFAVMREWIWSYFTGERSARLITGAYETDDCLTPK